MHSNPFHWPPPENINAGFAQGLVRADGELLCDSFREAGMTILRGQDFWAYMNELKTLHEGHWLFGLEAMGCRGMSRDVSRTHSLSQGEHEMNNQ